MALFVCKNISKSFKVDSKQISVLKNIDCIFPNCGLFAICGKSGCGKSTFLNILAGVEKPTSGEIIFCGKNICKFNDKNISKYHLIDISIIFQHYNLFEDFTVLDNVTLPMIMMKKPIIKSKEKAILLLKEVGIEELKDRKCSTLSGGEKQRVAICRALANDPKVILCDEPTGALNEENAEIIMNILKEISKTKLVILVSHNLDLVKKYSDKILWMKDGELTTNNDLDNQVIPVNKKVKYSSSFISKFLYLLFKKKRTILSIASLTIGFALLFVSLGFCIGSNNSEIRAFEQCSSAVVGTISETTFVKIENSPLSFQKSKRPNAELIDSVLANKLNYEIRRNYSYFFSNYPKGIFKNEIVDNFEMVPLLNFPSNNLNEVIINSQFAKEFSCGVGDEITITNSCDVSYQTGDSENPFIKDVFAYSYIFKVVDVRKEFEYLNSPKMYYSYIGIERELQNTPLEQISHFTGKYISVYDYLISSKDDDVYSSYSDYIFSSSSIDVYYKVIETLNNEKDTIQISCNTYQIYNSYKSFISTFSSSLLIFVVISFIGILLLLGFTSFSSFIQNKKQSAILTCLGSRNSSIISIYLNNTLLVLCISLIIGSIFSFVSEIVINKIIYSNLLLENLISIPFKTFLGIPFGLILLVFAVSYIFSALFTVLPILFYKKVNVADELRDE